MNKLYSISETATLVKTTAETLRHYDRIGLVKPHLVDELTNYRYYSEHEIVQLNIVKSLRHMDLDLKAIANLLGLNDFKQIVKVLKQAETAACNKIQKITEAKAKIAKARVFYEKKSTKMNEIQTMHVKTIPSRTIILLEQFSVPTLDILYNYHLHFYHQLGVQAAAKFAFVDVAGIFQEKDQSCMFTICTKYEPHRLLKNLPAGKYLCAHCTINNKAAILEQLLTIVRNEYHTTPKLMVQLIKLVGIIDWEYEIQIPIF